MPTTSFRQDVETRVLHYEVHPGTFVIEYRRQGCCVWLRLTKAYVYTENPRHWSLTHPWLFASHEEASAVASTMTSAWVLRHLTQDREHFHKLKAEREETLRLKRRK